MKKLNKHTDFMANANRMTRLKKIQYVKYRDEVKSDTELIDSLAKRIGHLETKAINKLLEDLELGTIMARYLSYKDMDVYYRSRQKLTELLQKIVSKL